MTKYDDTKNNISTISDYHTIAHYILKEIVSSIKTCRYRQLLWLIAVFDYNNKHKLKYF